MIDYLTTYKFWILGFWITFSILGLRLNEIHGGSALLILDGFLAIRSSSCHLDFVLIHSRFFVQSDFLFRWTSRRFCESKGLISSFNLCKQNLAMDPASWLDISVLAKSARVTSISKQLRTLKTKLTEIKWRIMLFGTQLAMEVRVLQSKVELLSPSYLCRFENRFSFKSSTQLRLNLRFPSFHPFKSISSASAWLNSS